MTFFNRIGYVESIEIGISQVLIKWLKILDRAGYDLFGS